MQAATDAAGAAVEAYAAATVGREALLASAEGLANPLDKAVEFYF